MSSSIFDSNSFFKCSRLHDHRVTADSCNRFLPPEGNTVRKLGENEMSETADISLLERTELQHKTLFCFSGYFSAGNK